MTGLAVWPITSRPPERHDAEFMQALHARNFASPVPASLRSYSAPVKNCKALYLQ